MRPNSFDVFDTLIARRCIWPEAIFSEVEKRAGASGFAEARRRAEKLFSTAGRPYNLQDVYHYLGQQHKLEEKATENLRKLEIQVELDNAIPIQANLNRVRDGDFLISDMYLSEDVIRQMLSKVGLRKQITLIVSTHGKSLGHVWDRVQSCLDLSYHRGDNAWSDFQVPSSKNIRAIIDTQAGLTDIEKRLIDAGLQPLAALIREVRLGNPYEDWVQRQLYDFSCQLNFPLLYLASIHLHTIINDRKIQRILFASRDGNLWIYLWKQFFPEIESEYFYSSRVSYLAASADYSRYALSRLSPSTILADLTGRGLSPSKFFHDFAVRPLLYFLLDTSSPSDFSGVYAEALGEIPEKLETVALALNSELEHGGTQAHDHSLLELLNSATHGSILDVRYIAEIDRFVPEFDQMEDHFPPYIGSIHEGFHKCLKTASFYEIPKTATAATIKDLLLYLLKAICGNNVLSSIFLEEHMRKGRTWLKAIGAPTDMVSIPEAFAIALEHHRAGRLREAETIFRRILDVAPDHADCLHLLGLIAYQQGQHESAVQWLTRAIQSNDRIADFHDHLGSALRAQGQREQAAAAFRRALTLDPQKPGVQLQLGVLLLSMGEAGAAADAFRAELARDPNHRSALLNLGAALCEQEKLQEAKASFQRLVEIDPGYAPAWNNLAAIQLEQGEVEAAAVNYDQAIRLDTNYAQAYSNRLMCEQYRASVTPEALLTLSRGWDDRFAPQPPPVVPAAPREAPLPLRLGFVSPDLFRSPIGYFLIGLLRHFDRAAVQTFLYADAAKQDDLTAELKSLATVWHETSAQTDEQLLALIRADNLDMVFDLAGHTHGNRLRVFAKRAAPLQATWAGYAGTTGLAAMDFLIADRWQVPEDAEGFYRERVLRMPNDYICYTPPPYAPEVGPLPIERNGYLTLAAFHNVGKIGALSIELWAKVLRELADARLIMKYKKLTDPVVQARIVAMFADAGIAADRLTIEGTSPHQAMLARYNDADIALDSRPYSGGLTTLEALLMGVPVITLPGRTFAGRHSLSHLSNAGLAELVARDEADYVQLVTDLARDRPRLAEMRRALRGRVAASPIGDAKRFAADFLDMVRQAVR